MFSAYGHTQEITEVGDSLYSEGQPHCLLNVDVDQH